MAEWLSSWSALLVYRSLSLSPPSSLKPSLPGSLGGSLCLCLSPSPSPSPYLSLSLTHTLSLSLSSLFSLLSLLSILSILSLLSLSLSLSLSHMYVLKHLFIYLFLCLHVCASFQVRTIRCSETRVLAQYNKRLCQHGQFSLAGSQGNPVSEAV